MVMACAWGNAEEGVEIGSGPVVGCRDEGATGAGASVAGVELDPGQVRLERDPVVVQVANGQRTAELDRRRVGNR
jgi:hypothetical protein